MRKPGSMSALEYDNAVGDLVDARSGAMQAAALALRKGSYVVNSSQGGGSKDTWVVD